MAAPIYAYKNKSLFMDGSEHLIAIKQADDATFNSRFYLDGYFPIVLPDGTKGVVGYVIESGANASMHNLTTRGGKGRLEVGSNKVRLLNDAGLNTKGQVVSFSINPQVGNRTAKTNNVTLKAAFYFDSLPTQYGIRYRQGASPTWLYIYGDSTLAKGTQITREFNFPSLTPNMSMEVQAFIQNSEGEHTSASYTVLVLTESVAMSYDSFGAYFGLCSAIKDTDVYYTDATISLGTMFFLNSTLSSAAPAGGYSDGTNYYQYSALSGVTAIYSCSTPPVRPSISYVSFENSAFAACMLDGLSGTIYYETVGGVTTWYTSSNPLIDTKASVGYYAYMDGANRMVLQVGSNGVQVSIQNCSEI